MGDITLQKDLENTFKMKTEHSKTMQPGDVYFKRDHNKWYVKAPEFDDFGPFDTEREAWAKAWKYADWLENEIEIDDL